MDSSSNVENSNNKEEKSPGSNDNQIACLEEDLPIEEVTVYGRATIVSFGFIRFSWSPFPGGGGGNSTTTFGDVDANRACQALGAEARTDLVNLAFIVARTLSTNPYSFAREHPTGSTFELTLPNGSVIRGLVSEPMATNPIIAEADNSCG